MVQRPELRRFAAGFASGSAADDGPSAPRRAVPRSGARHRAAADDLPDVIAIRTMPGRLRLKAAALHRNPALCAAAERALNGQNGILSARANAVIGSLVVTFPKGADCAAVIEMVRTTLAASTATHAAAPDDRRGETSGARAIAAPARSVTQPPASDWHIRDEGAVLSAFDVAPRRGLTEGAAKASLQRHGPNALAAAHTRSAWEILSGQLSSLPLVLLMASAGLSVVTGGLVDAAAILAAVGLNAGIGFTTESGAERAIHALTGLVHPIARVIRDGEHREIPVESVVPGDVLVLSPGMLVPADARVIEVRDLLIDESALTGESLPVEKATAALTRADAPLAERGNMVFRGTAVTGGSGLAVVVATGAATEIGRIRALVTDTRAPETPMEQQLERMGRQLVIASLGLCGGFFALGVLRGFNFLTLLKSTVALAVAAVPEGLPTVATTTLALGLRDMRSRNVLARRIDAIETLGAVNVICFDKTGTLTLNKMTVTAIVAGGRWIDLDAGRFRVGDQTVEAASDEALTHMLRVAALCSDVEVNGTGGSHTLKGSPTENALIEVCIGAGLDVNVLRREFPAEAVDYRTETRRFMRSVHTAGPGRKLIAIKGSPIEVLDMCATCSRDGTQHPIDDEFRTEVVRDNDKMAGRALRVLGFAYADGATRADGAPLVWLGLMGMQDPIRPGIRDIMTRFHRAGIKTVMITGDQSATAYAVARDLDLGGGRQIETLDGLDVAATDPKLMAALAARTDAYARVSPANKLEIVHALQQAGLVVAMTGDGINDSPALRAADIGVAMGANGTDAAKEVADIVLEDDNLNSMVAAVSQGRTTSRNIRKALHYLLATNSSEMFLMLAAVALGLPAPLSPMQLLWINLVTELAPALALGLEPDEPDVMEVPPRQRDAPIIAGPDVRHLLGEGLVLSAASLGAYLYGARRYGVGPRAGSVAFSTLVLSQILHARACRSDRYGVFDPGALPPNRYLNWAMGGLLAMQGAAMFLPGLRGFLGTAGLTVGDAGVSLLVAGTPLIINEAIKAGRAAGIDRAREPAIEARREAV